MRQLGESQWARIKALHSETLMYRSKVDLKDKWRNLKKGSRAKYAIAAAKVGQQWPAVDTAATATELGGGSSESAAAAGGAGGGGEGLPGSLLLGEVGAAAGGKEGEGGSGAAALVAHDAGGAEQGPGEPAGLQAAAAAAAEEAVLGAGRRLVQGDTRLVRRQAAAEAAAAQGATLAAGVEELPPLPLTAPVPDILLPTGGSLTGGGCFVPCGWNRCWSAATGLHHP